MTNAYAPQAFEAFDEFDLDTDFADALHQTAFAHKTPHLVTWLSRCSVGSRGHQHSE